jgi:hypothetical protein
MPALHNQKHENFCLLTVRGAAQGLSQAQIYQKAGYICGERVAAANASRLLKSANIRARIAELTAPAERKTRTTVDTLAEQFDRVFAGAVEAEQFGAAGNAAGLKAKLFGFMREKIELGGAGAFDQVYDIAGVVRVMLQDQTPAEALELLEILRAEIERYAADHAGVVAPAESARYRPDEAALALSYLRPKQRLRR